MKLKNFSRYSIRILAPMGGHVAIVKSGEARELPAHMEEIGIRSGLVPLEDVQLETERMAEFTASEKAKADAEAEAIAESSKVHAEALEEAVRKAKSSEAAKKSAATRAANKETK